MNLGIRPFGVNVPGARSASQSQSGKRAVCRPLTGTFRGFPTEFTRVRQIDKLRMKAD
jgi:hypothetical protein